MLIDCQVLQADSFQKPSCCRFTLWNASKSFMVLWIAHTLDSDHLLSRWPFPYRFSHDGQYLAIVSEEPALEVVNLRTGANLGRQVLRTCPVDVAWNPRRHILAFPGASERDGSGAEHGLVELRYLPEQGQS